MAGFGGDCESGGNILIAQGHNTLSSSESALRLLGEHADYIRALVHLSFYLHSIRGRWPEP